MVLLEQQDRRLWDRAKIAAAGVLLEEAALRKRPGPYQVQAAIVGCHAQAESWAETDWLQIVALYDVLLSMTPSPVVRLNRGIALRHITVLSLLCARSMRWRPIWTATRCFTRRVPSC